MRILHFIPSLEGGGAERQLSYLAPELARLGCEVHVAYVRGGVREPTLSGVIRHRLRSLGNHDPFLLFRVMRLLRHVKADVVHTWLVQMDVLGGMASEMTHVRWILREASSPPAYPPTWKHRARVRIARHAAAIVSNSAEGDRYWSRYYPDKNRCIVRNAVPLDVIDAIEEARPGAGDPDQGAATVLYVGRLIDYKNVDKLMAAMERVHAAVPVRLTVCGDGPMRETLRKQAESAGLCDAVEMTGFLDSRTIWKWMKRSDVFCSLSDFEGSPNTVLEAMACGVPLVVSDIPGHRELLDADSALFVDPKDVKAIAAAILSSISDGNAARARACIARQKSMQFSVRAMACQYMDVYHQVLQGGSCRG